MSISGDDGVIDGSAALSLWALLELNRALQPPRQDMRTPEQRYEDAQRERDERRQSFSTRYFG